MKKYLAALLSGIFCISLLSGFSNNTDTELTVKKTNLQTLSCNELPQDIIELYVDNNWTYNSELNQLEREVTYEDEIVEIDGQEYKTDENGEITLELDTSKSDTDIEIAVEMLTEDDSRYEIDTTIEEIEKGNDSIEIVEYMSLDDIIQSMDDEYLESVENTTEDENTGEVQVGGLTHGVKPANGAYVHCNRFNGYLGNGKYYSKTKNPAGAALNFIQSDCDVALAKSTKCLADYGSNPYCSTKNTTTAGKCSPNIVSHSRLYHKHTGWFSPTK